MALRILIVGSGIGGLAAALALTAKGHQVIVLEASRRLQAVGGIIVIQANGGRLLDHLGVYHRLLKICRSEPFIKGVRRYEDGRWLRKDAGVGYEEKYGYPMWNVHRADYQRVLHDVAVERGVIVRFDCRVESLNEDEPSVTIKGGEVLKGDIIIGADGMKSVVRNYMYPESEATVLDDTGMDITRVNIPFEIMNRDPATADLTNHIALWFGPRTLVANVPVQRGGDWILGYDFIAPRSRNSTPQKAMRQDFDRMKKHFDGWDPVIRNTVFGYVDEEHLDAYVWQMYETKPPEWVSKSGKVAILGDAAHGFTPWIGQGGTMAVEDAVALAECLSYPEIATSSSGDSSDSTDSTPPSSVNIRSSIDIPERLRTYQQIRQERAFKVQARSRFMGEMYLLPDGPHQKMRDEMMLQYGWDMDRIDVEVEKKYRYEWVDVTPTTETTPAEWDDWIIGFDAVDYARKKLMEKYGAELAA